MNYKFYKTDSRGYIHSIDNLVLTYYVEDIGVKCIDNIIYELRKLRDKYSSNYWEKMDVNPCRKYAFYRHVVHLDDGIYLLLGHYTDYDKETKEFTLFPMVRLEVNPNKHADKPLFMDLLTLLSVLCYDCSLNRYDYAIDIPVAPEYVKVFGTHKEKGLYKGTRYYGQRNKNGFCRIYDKSKEMKLDTPLTRVEHVFSLIKNTKVISFEKIYIRDDKIENLGDISKTDKVIVDLCILCRNNDLEFEDILNKLDRRKRKQIEQYIFNCSYFLLEFDEKLHDELLEEVKNYFECSELRSEHEEISVDDEGFLVVPDDLKLPFD